VRRDYCPYMGQGDGGGAAPGLDEVRRYAVAVARRRLRDRGVDAEDVAQDVLEHYWLLPELPRGWKPWVTVAVRHRVIDLARARRRAPDEQRFVEGMGPRAFGPSGGVIAAMQLAEVYAVLSAPERDILSWHIVGASPSEIAAEFAYASPAAASTTVSRIKRKVREQFPELQLDLEPKRPYGP